MAHALTERAASAGYPVLCIVPMLLLATLLPPFLSPGHRLLAAACTLLADAPLCSCRGGCLREQALCHLPGPCRCSPLSPAAPRPAGSWRAPGPANPAPWASVRPPPAGPFDPNGRPSDGPSSADTATTWRRSSQHQPAASHWESEQVSVQHGRRYATELVFYN